MTLANCAKAVVTGIDCMRIKWICLLLFASQACAQTEKISTQQVLVNGRQSDAEAGQDAIAGKIVIGKQRIAESGVQNVGELLRREPAISIGKDGRLGLLGLPGYTQVLVDGLPPQGDPFATDLVHIERIEILKSTTAASGPVGIAGTINIVRRQAERKAFTQGAVGASSIGGRVGANLSWMNNQVSVDSPFIYNLSLSARRTETPAASHYVETRSAPGAPAVPAFTGDATSSEVFQSLTAAGEFAWTPAPRHKLAFAPDLGRFQAPAGGDERRRWTDGRRLAIAQDRDDTMTLWSLPLRWNWQGADSALALRLQVNGQRRDSDLRRREDGFDTAPFLRGNGTHVDGRNRLADLEFHTTLDGGHEISSGARLTRNDAAQAYDDTVDGRPDPSLAVLGTTSATRMDSGRLFVQDEWRIDRTLALNVGLSVERRVYALDEGFANNRAAFNMWSPSLHLSKKIGGDRKRQFRVSLARSFQPPAIEQLLLHPAIDRFAPCPPGRLCGANDIDTSDRSGNPHLQPESALGLNLSYAHGIGAGSEAVVEWYARDIHDKTGWEYALADVPWASAPRYVTRPVNLGQASVRGVNLEGRLAGKDLAKSLAALEAHGSLGFARSALSDVPGPDNRIAGQSPWRLKFGGSYTLKAAPLRLGVEANVLPSDWVRDSLRQRIYTSSRTTLGVNGRWTIDAKTHLTVNLDNLLHKTTTRIDAYQSTPDLLRLSSGSADYARIGVKFDTSL
jgi:outer membrane receptor for ferrienterochelin and colicins